MLDEGYGVYVVEDASGGTSRGAHDAAIRRIEQAGGVSVTALQVLLSSARLVAIQADAADADAVKAAVEKAVATFGRLDVLVNNAGTAIPKPFEETTLEEMDRVIDINIRGVFVATQAALKHHARRWSHHFDRIGRRERVRGARACALRGYEGSRQDVHSGPGPRNREPGTRSTTCSPAQSRRI